MIKKPYDLKNVNFYYILKGKCLLSNPKEISELIKIYDKQEICFGPEWCKAVYFYLIERH
jgi:hypothetical protein